MTALELTKELVAFESPSHVSNEQISRFLESRLKQLDFDVEVTSYQDPAGVEKWNVLARIGPEASSNPGLAYFCHSDVVPADTWSGPGEAFQATEHDDKLFGRGSCDMKGSAACMLTALSSVDRNKLTAPFYFGCTADEEVSYRGAMQMVANSTMFRQLVSEQPRVLIGEPTRLRVVYAHKGICTLRIVSTGRAAHSSTRDGINANLAMIPFLQKVKDLYDEIETDTNWQNDEFDPPTLSLNIGINDRNKALNVTAEKSECVLFYRPLPNIDDGLLIDRLRDAASENGLKFSDPKRVSSVYTDPNNAFVKEATELAGEERPQTVSYGTDAGAMQELKDIIVCGPGDIAQAHTTDEWISLDQLDRGTQLYEKFLRQWCMDGGV